MPGSMRKCLPYLLCRWLLQLRMFLQLSRPWLSISSREAAAIPSRTSLAHVRHPPLCLSSVQTPSLFPQQQAFAQVFPGSAKICLRKPDASLALEMPLLCTQEGRLTPNCSGWGPPTSPPPTSRLTMQDNALHTDAEAAPHHSLRRHGAPQHSD